MWNLTDGRIEFYCKANKIFVNILSRHIFCNILFIMNIIFWVKLQVVLYGYIYHVSMHTISSLPSPGVCMSRPGVGESFFMLSFNFTSLQGYILCILIISPTAPPTNKLGGAKFFEFISQKDAFLRPFPLFSVIFRLFFFPLLPNLKNQIMWQLSSRGGW